jgi:ABC-type multidrug transport system ATPase subunit
LSVQAQATELPANRDELALQSVSRPARLQVTDVTKTWGKTNRVLDAVTISLSSGQLAALIGVNGAGKTTLLRIVSGLIEPEGGSVRLDGLHPRRNRVEYQRRLGFVSAGQGGLTARISVLDQLDYWARIAFVPRRSRAAAIDRTLERFALRDLASSRVDRLSMGQRQRVRLALGFLHEPHLVLLDEPQNSLDPDGLALVESVLGDFLGGGGSVVWCAPTAEAVNPTPDVVWSLEGGRLK